MKTIPTIKLNTFLALSVFIFVGSACAPPGDRAGNSSLANRASINSSVTEPQLVYSKATVKMTSQQIKSARVESKIKLEFDFPYSGGGNFRKM